MTSAGKKVFRADHVGSLLRPKYLLEARAQKARGEIAAEALREVEDRAIREAVALQEEAGLQTITDGEFRRAHFHTDFLKHLDGVIIKGGLPVKFHNRSSEIEFSPPRPEVMGRIGRSRGLVTDDFSYLKSLTQRTAKVAIPSPTMLHFRGGRKAIDEAIYPDIEEFFEDLARAYREEVAALGNLGCEFIQLDDTNLAYLCDENLRARTRDIGEDPDQLPKLYADLINRSIASKPASMAIGIHLCRGNFRSAWVAEGGYDPVAEVLFNELDIDTYFLEYDDERSGGFEPLRFVPKNKTVVLGLISSKVPALESKDEIKRRIEEASKFCDLDQLALSPQCGFSSTAEGNAITPEDQLAKLRLVVEIAEEVWGKP
jgi:5-methyltetrahydropteroyltriglutamate--homocysteine methyltransferase